MKIYSIQLLRGVAVLLIVYSQSIGLTMDFTKSQEFYYLRHIGLLGQDLFFVITGFVITYTASQRRGLEEGFLFLQQRFFRISPLYYIASILFIGFHVLHIWISSHMMPMPFSMILTSLADTLLIVPVSADLGGFKPLLAVGWVLAFGCFFYMLYFFSIVAGIRKKSIGMIVVLILLAVAGMVLKPADLRLSVLTNPILLEFALGILIGQLYLRSVRLPVPIAALLVLAGIGWYIFLVFYGYGSIWFDKTILNGTQSWQRVLLWGLPAGCMLAGCVFLERAGRLPQLWHNRVGQLVGDAAYSIYLVHASVFSLIAMLYSTTGLRLPPDLGIFIQLLVAVLVCLAFYRWIERPLLRWLSKPGHQAWLTGSRAQTQPV